MSAEEPPGLSAALLAGSPGVERLRARLAGGHPTAVGNLWGSSQALLLAALAAEGGAGPFLVLCSTEAEGDAFAEDLAACGLASLAFPARDSGSLGGGHVDPESLRLRLQAAHPNYPDIVPKEGQTVDIWGVVVATIHQHST